MEQRRWNGSVCNLPLPFGWPLRSACHSHDDFHGCPLPCRCINVLLELIQTKVNYVVQEAIIVIKDIFR